MKMTVKAKNAFPHAGKLKHVRVEIDPKHGASVHTMHHPSKENEWPSEQPAGSFGTPEEAFHHAAKLGGVDSTLEPPVGETNVAQNAGDAEEAETVRPVGKHLILDVQNSVV